MPYERAIPDANVWLDAAFVPGGPAFRAIEALRAAHVPVFLEGSIEAEVLRSMHRRSDFRCVATLTRNVVGRE